MSITASNTQASVSLANNGGDIGATLKDLGKGANLRNLVTTMATAGALQNLDQALGFNNSTQTATGQTGAGASGINGVSTSQAVNNFAQNALKNITNNVAGAVINSAITGQPLNEQTLATALGNGLVTAGMASGANAIGDAATSQNGQAPAINAFTQAVAHAVLGCVGAAATNGGGACAPGAAGAVVGELSAKYATEQLGMNNADALSFAKVMSATAGALVGGSNNAMAVNVAATTGGNAAANNRLLHPTEINLAKQLAANSNGVYTEQQIEDAMRNAANSTYNETVTSNLIVDASKKPMDPGAQFTAPVNGQAAQLLPNNGNVDPNLASFTQANTGGANSSYSWTDPQVGKVTPVAVDPNANISIVNSGAGLNTLSPSSNGCITAACAAGLTPDRNPIRDIIDMRNDLADGAGLIGRGAGIVSNTATAIEVTSPDPRIKAGAAAVGATATVIDFASKIVEQAARPDIGKGVIEVGATILGDIANKVAPIAAPISNEFIEKIKSTNEVQNLQNKIGN